MATVQVEQRIAAFEGASLIVFYSNPCIPRAALDLRFVGAADVLRSALGDARHDPGDQWQLPNLQ